VTHGGIIRSGYSRSCGNNVYLGRNTLL